MAEYIDKNKIPWAKVDNPQGISWERIVFESVINNIPPADVVEHSKIDKAIEEIENTDFDFGDFFDYTDTIRKMVVEILKRNIGECKSK